MPPMNSARKMVDIELFQPKRLSKGALTNATLQVYPASSGTVKSKALIRKLFCNNITGGSVNLTVRVVPTGSTSIAANDILTAVPIAANSFLYIDFGKDGLVLEAGDSVFAHASANTSLNLILSGGEEWTS